MIALPAAKSALPGEGLVQSAAIDGRPTPTTQLLRSGRLAGVEWRDLVALTPLEIRARAHALPAVAGALARLRRGASLSAGAGRLVHDVPHRPAPGPQRPSPRPRPRPPRQRVVPVRHERGDAGRHACREVQSPAPSQALHGRGRRRGGERAHVRLAGDRLRPAVPAAAAPHGARQGQPHGAPVDLRRARRQRRLDRRGVPVAAGRRAPLPRHRHGRRPVPDRVLRRLDRASRYRRTPATPRAPSAAGSGISSPTTCSCTSSTTSSRKCRPATCRRLRVAWIARCPNSASGRYCRRLASAAGAKPFRGTPIS